MLLAIVVLTLICSIVGMYELAWRTEHFRTEAEYCRQSEQGMSARAELESLASDPSRETELPFALFKRTRWSRGGAARDGVGIRCSHLSNRNVRSLRYPNFLAADGGNN